ncbi:MAG: hypothetical protein HY936_11180 [Nitrosomonadales bacterium]|nr:hypothetical protein [Nitrosomonadales bacterium]
MKLDENMKLADLMYGHGEKFMCLLSGNFDHEKFSDAPPVHICEMKCGCWIVVDGNNRVGLILKENPEATIADIPKSLLATARYGKWDDELMVWWNPCAKSFRSVMAKQGKKAPEPKDAIYGIIERSEKGSFFAATLNVKEGASATTATGRTANEAKMELEGKIKKLLKRENIPLVLMQMTPLV